MAGDEDLIEAVIDRQETVEPALAAVAMADLPSSDKTKKIKFQFDSGRSVVYFINVAPVKRIKENEEQLSCRRADIIKIEDDSKYIWKIGLTHDTVQRSDGHAYGELKDTPVNESRVVDMPSYLREGAEDALREHMRKIGTPLPRTQDWFTVDADRSQGLMDELYSFATDYRFDNDYRVKEREVELNIKLLESNHKNELQAAKNELLEANCKNELLEANCKNELLEANCKNELLVKDMKNELLAKELEMKDIQIQMMIKMMAMQREIDRCNEK